MDLVYKPTMHYKPTPCSELDVRDIAHGLIVCIIWYMYNFVHSKFNYGGIPNDTVTRLKPFAQNIL